ncbi:MAG: 6,7-dimethyl-8-ribityllumazine synthase [Candidatus Binatia bacterium]
MSAPKTHIGQLRADTLRIGIVMSRFNSVVTDRLLQGALKALRECGAAEERIEVVQVPGAFEIPLFADALAHAEKFDALVCLGAIIRGETQHHDYLSRAVTEALQQLQLARHMPIALGILTTENVEQALQRAGNDRANKGFEAALTAVETANLLKRLG